MRRGGGISIIGVIYLLIGVAVAGFRGYLVDWTVIGNVIEGILAVLVWPVVLLGVDLHGLIP
ncbi:hypothetical protein GCM10025866_30740 [Naasia aerilata]|uniref:Uncharacterized protein n=2 Tax=Naasia aerilata TaxID=1162966 RepID=A0ABM8GFN4_9MICO|nr:hypothetical protein GCM10025866_30740 [Naasia aerilata]